MRHAVLIFGLSTGFWLAGCGECEECEECQACACGEDADGDGYSAEQGDCDDGDASVYPRAEEICGDGIDQDCSGDPDDGFTDADGDGAIDVACSGGDDCDDTDPERYPDAEDICDGADNNCDGRIDEDTIVVDPDGDGDEESIQDAIDAADYEDAICVRAGTYEENIVLQGKNLSVIAPDGADATIIDGRDRGTTVTFELGDNSTLQGFTIIGGSGTSFDADNDGSAQKCGGGVFVDASHGNLTGCVITANSAEDGAGIYVNNANLTMESSVVTMNTASEYGGGLRLRRSEGVLIESSQITSNIAKTGGGLALWNSEATLVDTLVQGNESTGNGGGMYIGSDSLINLSACTVTENVAAGSGAGIRLYGASASIGATEITFNNAQDQGGGIACKNSEMSLTDSTTSDNMPDDITCDECDGCSELR